MQTFETFKIGEEVFNFSDLKPSDLEKIKKVEKIRWGLGLKDKTGKLLFEGDSIKIDEDDTIYEVIFNEEMKSFVLIQEGHPNQDRYFCIDEDFIILN
jgi:hypothetical protein